MLTPAPRMTPRAPRSRMPFANTALFALASDIVNGEVLPRIQDGLLWMEVLHAALVKQSDREGLGPSPCLSGKDGRNAPLKGHGHAWLLPMSLERRGQTDHVLVYAPMGFDERAREALDAVRVMYAKQVPRTFLTLMGMGERVHFEQAVPGVRAARVWRTVLPFVPPRHLKRQGRSALEGQIQAELGSRGLPAAARIEVELEGGAYVAASGFWPIWAQRRPGEVRVEVAAREVAPAAEQQLASHWRLFRSARLVKPEQQPPVGIGIGLRITFEKEVRGPIALGYASHFGLGAMDPEP